MYIFWTILGIVFLYLDLIKKNTVNLTVATTCLFCAIIAYKFPENYLYQGISLISFYFISHFLIKTVLIKEKSNKIKTEKLDDFVGKKAKVIKDIGKTLSIDGIGYIRYNSDLWQAKSIDDKEIKSGNTVEIVSKENMIMNVKVVK